MPTASAERMKATNVGQQARRTDGERPETVALILPADLPQATRQVFNAQVAYNVWRSTYSQAVLALADHKRMERSVTAGALNRLVGDPKVDPTKYTKTDAPKHLDEDQYYADYMNKLGDLEDQKTVADNELAVARNTLNTARLLAVALLPAGVTSLLGEEHN